MAKIAPTKPLLIMLYGFPGAGKTYFARQLTEQLQAAHVQSDRIRSELFEQPRYDKEENTVVAQLAEYMAEEFLNAGVSVVFDMNALRYSQRHALRETARKNRAHAVLIWFQIDPDSAFARINKRDKRRLDDRYSSSLDRATFDKLSSGMQNPRNIEDYIVVSGKHVFNTQFTAVVKRLHELGLVQLNDTVARMVKPGLVNLIPNPMAGRVDMSRRNIVIR